MIKRCDIAAVCKKGGVGCVKSVENNKKQVGVLRDHTGTCDYRKTNVPPPTHSSSDETYKYKQKTIKQKQIQIQMQIHTNTNEKANIK